MPENKVIFSPLIPELTVMNLQKSLDFYTDVCEFKVMYKREKEKFAFLEREGAQLMIEERNYNWEVAELEAPFGRGINFQITVIDIRKLELHLEISGTELWKEAHEEWYRIGLKEVCVRQLLLQDPDGYLLRFSQFLN